MKACLLQLYFGIFRIFWEEWSPVKGLKLRRNADIAVIILHQDLLHEYLKISLNLVALGVQLDECVKILISFVAREAVVGVRGANPGLSRRFLTAQHCNNRWPWLDIILALQ